MAIIKFVEQFTLRVVGMFKHSTCSIMLSWALALPLSHNEPPSEHLITEYFEMCFFALCETFTVSLRFFIWSGVFAPECKIKALNAACAE